MLRYLSLACFLLLLHATAGGDVPTSNLTISQAKNVPEDESALRAVRYPCQCVAAQCGCCTGNIIQNFNVNVRQRVCANFTYDADDFAIGMKLLYNDRVLYNNKVSGKNPPPVCLPIPRIAAIRVCAKLTNVYFIGRNVHACVVLETQWNKETAFAMNFDCIRIGADGMAVVSPEEGGGLPHPQPTITVDIDGIEEYDELLENSTTYSNQTTTVSALAL